MFPSPPGPATRDLREPTLRTVILDTDVASRWVKDRLRPLLAARLARVELALEATGKRGAPSATPAR